MQSPIATLKKLKFPTKLTFAARLQELRVSEICMSPIKSVMEQLPEEIPPSVLFIDDLSQFLGLMVFIRAKGRDKLSAFAQNFAKVVAAVSTKPKHQNIWGTVENNISASRKTFKLFKYFLGNLFFLMLDATLSS